METAARAGGENIGSATALVTTIPRRKSRREGVPSLISCPSNIVASSNTRITREGERILSAQLATRSGVPANALVAWGRALAQRRFGGSPGSAIAELTSCTMQQAIVCRRKRLRIRQSHPLRGPKPVRALREIGLAADVTADEPTTTTVLQLRFFRTVRS